MFKDYAYVEKSLIIGVGPDGQKNGLAAILLEDQKAAEQVAKDLDGNYIGLTFVDVSVITYGDYLKFNGK